MSDVACLLLSSMLLITMIFVLTPLSGADKKGSQGGWKVMYDWGWLVITVLCILCYCSLVPCLLSYFTIPSRASSSRILNAEARTGGEQGQSEPIDVDEESQIPFVEVESTIGGWNEELHSWGSSAESLFASSLGSARHSDSDSDFESVGGHSSGSGSDSELWLSIPLDGQESESSARSSAAALRSHDRHYRLRHRHHQRRMAIARKVNCASTSSHDPLAVPVLEPPPRGAEVPVPAGRAANSSTAEADSHAAAAAAALTPLDSGGGQEGGGAPSYTDTAVAAAAVRIIVMDVEGLTAPAPTPAAAEANEEEAET